MDRPVGRNASRPRTKNRAPAPDLPRPRHAPLHPNRPALTCSHGLQTAGFRVRFTRPTCGCAIPVWMPPSACDYLPEQVRPDSLDIANPPGIVEIREAVWATLPTHR